MGSRESMMAGTDAGANANADTDTSREGLVKEGVRAMLAEDLVIPKHICVPRREGRPAFKFGVFGGLHGDEEAGTLACVELAAWAAGQPAETVDYELHFYPMCNPTGCEAKTRHSRAGLDLNREFWCGSAQPEIVFLEAELRRERYDGIIQLHADDTSEGCYGFVSGSLMSELLLEPALKAVEGLLPRNTGEVIDGFASVLGIIKAGYTGILCAPPEQHPRPLEIVFETPALASLEVQVEATVLAVKTILAEYRELQAYAANL